MAFPKVSVVSSAPAPILGRGSPCLDRAPYGIESGRVVKQGGVYHLFTTEMAGEPRWVKTRIARFTSGDRRTFRREGTIFESGGEMTGRDPRAALWGAMPIFDEAARRWNLFHVGYRSLPAQGNRWLLNHDGRVWRSVSAAPGAEGIGGPYEDAGIVLEPGPDSEPWEDFQGTDSFCPFETRDGWLAFYGSARPVGFPTPWPAPLRPLPGTPAGEAVDGFWRVGLARAPRFEGPWTRIPGRNPLPIEPRFIENPIVTSLPGGLLAVVYDSDQPGAVGIGFSENGLDWTRGDPVPVQPPSGGWASDVRTPLCLIPEEEGTFTLFYTGFERSEGGEFFSAMGMATLRLE